MEECFSDLLSRLLFASGEGRAEVTHLDTDWTSGALRVELRDGRKFSLHFSPAE